MDIFVYIWGVIYFYDVLWVNMSEWAASLYVNSDAYLFETGFHNVTLADLDLTVEPRLASNCSIPPVCLPSAENVGLYHYVFLTSRKYVNSMIEIMV